MISATLKQDFPILSNKVNGKELVYLDSSATSQKPRTVIDAISNYYYKFNSNVHRGIYKISVEATNEYESARDSVKKFINAKSNKEIIFTKNATEAINLIAGSYTRFLNKGDEILLTETEHHSNIVPWQLITQERGLKIRYVKIKENGYLDDIKFSKNTKVISIIHTSNVLGTINDIKKIARIAHDNNAIIVVDGAQSVPHMKIDVQDLDIDFLVFSGHKMMAGTGIGVLYGKEELLEKMAPFLAGGDMIKEVNLQEAKFNDLPWKFEAGTQNIEGVISMKAAIQYLNKLGMDNVEKHEKEITKYALEKISKISNVEIYGPKDYKKRGPIISFNVNGIHAHDVATILDEEGIAIRSGHHCCQPLMHALKISGSCRASFYVYNTKEDVDKLVKGLEVVNKIFNKSITKK